MHVSSPFQSHLMRGVLLLVCVSLLSVFTVVLQVRTLGRDYLAGEQMRRHRAILEGTAKAPYQYRLLSEYVLAGILRFLRATALPEPVFIACFGMRLMQNMLIFLLAAWYYRASGFRLYSVLLGVALLAWGMSHAYYNSDLAFNTYFDIVFYLTAALLIHYQQDVWLIPVTLLAALNRETSGLIPVMFVAVRYSQVRHHKKQLVKLISVAGGAGMVYGVIFVALRIVFGPRQLSVPGEYSPGIEFVFYNLGRPITYIQLAATLAILPIMAAFSWRVWPGALKKMFWAVIPAWLVIHLCYSVIAETRLLLVPFALILVPGVLFGLEKNIPPAV